MTKHTTPDLQPEFPYPKLCECGCGQPAPIAQKTDKRYGATRGQPRRFAQGHHRKIVRPRPVEDRFWDKVRKDTSGGCWGWTGTGHSGGYGIFSITSRPTVMELAHRFSWELHFGPIPDGMVVCHTCDNPPCVNPAHLFLGTQADNVADMLSKGRGALPPRGPGEANGNAKLTEAQVIEIRHRAAQGETRASLARSYEVSWTQILRIVDRISWKHI